MPNAHAPAHEDEIAPEFTVPQGTQEYGVETGHEETDANVGAIIRWLVGLAVVCIAVFALIRGVHVVWTNYAAKEKEPSPMFARAIQPIPPEPRVLPNPADPSAPGEPMMGPAEFGEKFRAQEREKLAKLGLWNAEKQERAIPGAAAARATQEGAKTGSAAAALDWDWPSEPSGGTRMENRLR